MPGPYWCTRLNTRAWKTDYIPLATQKDLPRIYMTRCTYVSPRIRTSHASQMGKRNRKENKDGIGLTKGIKCINGTGERTQYGDEVRAVLRYLVTAIGRPTNFKTRMARPRLESLGMTPPLPPSPPPRKYY